jgi:hypothetical protein
MSNRDKRQGVYLRLNRRARRTPLYVGKTVGAKRSFAKREAEHLRELDAGTHANDAMRRAHQAAQGQGWQMLPLVVVKDAKLARLIESIIIKAMGKAVCNERG